MDKYDLYGAVGELDEKVLERSEKRKSKRWLRVLFAIVALCIIAALAVISLMIPEKIAPIDTSSDILHEHDTFDSWVEQLTSDTKNGFSRLTRGVSSATNAQKELKEAVFGNHLYFIEDGIKYVDLKYIEFEDRYLDTYEYTNTIDFSTPTLISFGDRLIVYNEPTADDVHTKETVVRIYDVSDSANPKVLTEYKLTGNMIAYYFDNGELVLFAYDGLPDCGHIKEGGIKAYRPTVFKDNTSLDFSESEITVVGDPFTLQYVYMLRIDPISGNVARKQAFCCDARKLHYGEGWFAFDSKAPYVSTDRFSRINVFENAPDGIKYLGRITPSALLGLDESGDDEFRTVYDVSVSSVTYVEGILRIWGSASRDQLGNGNNMFAATVNLSASEYNAVGFYSSYVISWFEEDGKTLMVHNKTDENRTIIGSCFSAIVYSGMDIMHVTFDNVVAKESSVSIEERIKSVGNGVYVAYNKELVGIEIMNFSDVGKPIYRTISAANRVHDNMSNFKQDVYILDDGDICIGGYAKASGDAAYWIYNVKGNEDASVLYERLINIPYKQVRDIESIVPLEYNGTHYIILRLNNITMPYYLGGLA